MRFSTAVKILVSNATCEFYLLFLAITGGVFALLLLIQDAKKGYLLQKAAFVFEGSHVLAAEAEMTTSANALDFDIQAVGGRDMPLRSSPGEDADMLSTHTFRSFLSRDDLVPEVLGTTRFISRTDPATHSLPRSEFDISLMREADQISIE